MKVGWPECDTTTRWVAKVGTMAKTLCDAPNLGVTFFFPILATGQVSHDKEISVATGCLGRMHDPVVRVVAHAWPPGCKRWVVSRAPGTLSLRAQALPCARLYWDMGNPMFRDSLSRHETYSVATACHEKSVVTENCKNSSVTLASVVCAPRAT